MVDPIITPGVALVGTGTWFANKLLGPSADALGSQIKSFATERLKKIFKKAEELSAGKDMVPIPAGFALTALQKASFSEDDDTLTVMWANLLLDATQGCTSRHSLFSDILSQIGPLEAKALDEFSPFPKRGFSQSEVDAILSASIKGYDSAYDDKDAVVYNLKKRVSGCPLVMLYASVFNVGIDGPPIKYSINFELDQIVFEVLQRQNLVNFFSTDSSNGLIAVSVKGFILTELGSEFLVTCKGQP